MDEFRVTAADSKIDGNCPDSDRIRLVRSDLYRIMDLNMTAIRERAAWRRDRRGRHVADRRQRDPVRSARLRALLIRFPAKPSSSDPRTQKGLREIANFHYDKRSTSAATRSSAP